MERATPPRILKREAGAASGALPRASRGRVGPRGREVGMGHAAGGRFGGRFAPGLLGLAALVAASAGCHAVVLNNRLPSGPETETPSFVIRSDVTGAPRALLGAAAEEMRAELERLLPAGAGAGNEDKRRIVVFARRADFERYLSAHLFGPPTAIGFYCDLGEECALAWRDPPGPEDLRVLRHELVHQHLASRLETPLPAWLEEGLAERLALAVPPSLEAGVGDDATWADYRARRLAADTIFAALEIHAGRRSFEGREAEPASAVPAPSWASGSESGYVYHLLFVRFLLEAEDGRYAASLARWLDQGVRGEPVALDLRDHFATVADVEQAFHSFVVNDALNLLSGEASCPRLNLPKPLRSPTPAATASAPSLDVGGIGLLRASPGDHAGERLLASELRILRALRAFIGIGPAGAFPPAPRPSFFSEPGPGR